MAGSCTKSSRNGHRIQPWQPGARPASAFTLIELLIVVAIIAILAAVAVPNFLEAQTRAKVSRCRADFRAISTAVESYALDTGQYPVGTTGDTLWNLYRLTTPVSYMTSVTFQDSFKPRDQSISNPNSSYLYYSYKSPGMYNQAAATAGQGSFILQCVAAWQTPASAPKLWLITSLGPDRNYNAIILSAVEAFQQRHSDAINRHYDPTNGTLSSGDLGRFGGAIPGNIPIK